jgi:spermidine/putrescine transport system substrate-binding protein
MKQMTQARSFLFFLLVVVAISLVGCDNRTPVGEADTTNWAEHVKLPKAGFTPDDTLEVITYYEYIPQDVFDLFARTYGTKIVPTLVASNEDMFELLKKNPSKYDVVTPSDYMVTKMINSGLLHRLDQANIPNMENLDEDVRRAVYDPGLNYCIPLFRTSLGMAFNITYISGIPRNWNFLVKQLRNDYLAYRVGITKEMRFAMGISLQLLGYSPNTINPQEINEARDLLIDAVNRYGFVLMGAQHDDESLGNNDILLGVTWNGTAASALRKNPNIRFLLPEGPVLVTIDNAVISAQSKRSRTAELFTNFLLTPQVIARITNYNYFPNSISASLPFVKRNIRTGPGFLFPEEENRLFLKDLGPNSKLYEDAWALVLQAKTPKTLVKLPLPKGGFFKGDSQLENFSKDFVRDMQDKKKEGAIEGMKTKKKEGP